MAYESTQANIGTWTAGADLSSSQYMFVKFTAANSVIACTAITDVPCGVLQNNPVSGGAANVCIGGASKVAVHATLAAGDVIGVHSNSKALPIVAGTDTTQYVLGQATEVGASGGISTITVNITNGRAA